MPAVLIINLIINCYVTFIWCITSSGVSAEPPNFCGNFCSNFANFQTIQRKWFSNHLSETRWGSSVRFVRKADKSSTGPTEFSSLRITSAPSRPMAKIPDSDFKVSESKNSEPGKIKFWKKTPNSSNYAWRSRHLWVSAVMIKTDTKFYTPALITYKFIDANNLGGIDSGCQSRSRPRLC